MPTGGSTQLLALEVLPRLTGRTAFTSWRLDPFALAVVLLAAGLYLNGIRAARRRGRRWSLPRTAGFVGLGLGAIVIATMSMLAVYARVLFWPATTANILLDLVAPLGLAVGDPIGLARLSLTDRGRSRLEAVLASRFLRFWTFPLISSAAVLSSELSIYFTGYFQAALAHGAIWQLMHLQLLVTGLLFVVPMLTGQELLPGWCTPGLRVLLVFLDGLFDSIPGLLILFSTPLLAGEWYAVQARDWGPSLRLDQQLAGGILFTLAELVSLPFLIAVFVEWWRSERTRTAELDAQLDAEDAERARSAASTGPGPSPERERPWWETEVSRPPGRARSDPPR